MRNYSNQLYLGIIDTFDYIPIRYRTPSRGGASESTSRRNGNYVAGDGDASNEVDDPLIQKSSPNRAVRNLMAAFWEQTLTIDLTELVKQRAKRRLALSSSKGQARFRKS